MSKQSSHWIDGPSDIAQIAAEFGSGTDRSQRLILELLLKYASFTSVVDFGTGRGAWLKEVLKLGVDDIRGYDIPEIPIESRQFPPEKFFPADLSKLVDVDRKFDLSISTEVAEHIPAEGAQHFIKNLCSFSDLVLFSAAPPYQSGAGHSNENWVEYWVKLFDDNSFICFDIFREKLWNEVDVRSYYRQNIFLFASVKFTDKLKTKNLTPCEKPLSIIHPEQYLKAVNRSLPPQAKNLGRDIRQYYSCVFEDLPTLLEDDKRHFYGKDVVGWHQIKEQFVDKPIER